MNHHQTQRAAKRHAAQAHRLRSAGALNSQLSTVKPRSGFTLVEMLVSVALVVIMMSMFATVFQLAAGSMGTQRGIAENDQRARSVVTVIQNDLKVRSFKNLIPFDAYAEPTGPISFADRQGYFYISENELRDDTDDVLQFTVKLDGTSNDLYYGKATALFPLSTNTPMTSFLNSNNNEPERDDQNPSPDGSSASTVAEIAIFMRGGRLYRRVLLIRDQPTAEPPNDSGEKYFNPDNDGDTTPTPTIPEPYANIAFYNTNATGNFWNDFDFSAHSSLTFGNSGAVTANGGVEFHGISDLNNDAASSGFFPLGKPSNRFGHNHLNGLPREFYNGSSGFFGRFTHEETSDSAFLYPQSASTAVTPGNPMDQDVTLTDADNDSVIDEFNSGRRIAEDMLLANVHAFDVKVWDDALGRFVDIGHSIAGGDFNANENQHTNQINSPMGVVTFTPVVYGPKATAVDNRVFDTWYPGLRFPGGMTVTPPGMGTPPPKGKRGEAGQQNTPPPYRPTVGANGSGNPKPLKAIQITIRYYDVSSNQLRQVTQQISLVD